MPTYRVSAQETIYTYRTVEAGDPRAAVKEVMTEGFHGVIFLDHTYPDEGEWCADDVAEIDPDSHRVLRVWDMGELYAEFGEADY